MLLVDLFPECPLMLDLFTTYFDWLELVHRRAHTDSSLRYTTDLHVQWQDLAIRLFGKEAFERKIKFHAGVHVAMWTIARGSLLWYNDADGELLNKSNAKVPWGRTNTQHGRHGAERQMTTIVGRCDLLELLLQVRREQEAAAAPVRVAPPPAQALPSAKLMGNRRTVLRIRLNAAAALDPALRQLPFSTSFYLQLTSNGSENVDYPGGMPSLTSDSIEIRPGVAVQRWCDSL